MRIKAIFPIFQTTLWAPEEVAAASLRKTLFSDWTIRWQLHENS
ncbi:MAG: hypothetical protein ACTXOO_04360 [Sodalis sp. (in: enterobacteria)]